MRQQCAGVGRLAYLAQSDGRVCKRVDRPICWLALFERFCRHCRPGRCWPFQKLMRATASSFGIRSRVLLGALCFDEALPPSQSVVTAQTSSTPSVTVPYLMVATTVSVVALTIYVPSLPLIATDLGTSATMAQFSLTAFVLTFGIVQLWTRSSVRSLGSLPCARW